MAAAYLLHPKDFLKELEVGIKESMNTGHEGPRYSNRPALLGWGGRARSELTVLGGPACLEAPMWCGVLGTVGGTRLHCRSSPPSVLQGATRLVHVCASVLPWVPPSQELGV